MEMLMNVDNEAYLDVQNMSKPVAEFGLVFYKSDRGYAITRHNFVNETMQAGSIMDHDTVLSMLDDIKSKDSSANNNAENSFNIIPNNLLVNNHKALVWHSASRFAPMWFRLSGHKPFRLDVHYPPLLFMVNKKTRSMNIYALKNDERPTSDTITYNAPLANIFSNAKLCQGSAPLPALLDESTLTEIENTLYNSAFDGFKHKEIFLENNDPVTFWKDLHKSGGKIDAEKELYAHLTLSELLSTEFNLG